MKKFVLAFVALIVLVLAALVGLIYRWTFTPFGRLHPVMGVIHRLMILISDYGIFDRNNLPQVRKLMSQVNPRVPISETSDRTIDGPGGKIPIRIYAPSGKGPLPVIVYFHGGGFSIGCIESHENISRSIANSASAIVVSVGYRLAPEHPFPAAFDDAYAATQWVAENAADFKGDPGRLAVAGDSAGGNLAAAVSLKARDENGPSIGLQILLYPTTALSDTDFPSRSNFLGYVLTEESGENVVNYYLPDPADRTNPYASPLLAADHSQLPPSYIMTAAFDPLLDEGRRFGEVLNEAGVPVVYRNYEGMLHGFLSFADLVYFFPLLNLLLKEPNQVYADIADVVHEWL